MSIHSMFGMWTLKCSADIHLWTTWLQLEVPLHPAKTGRRLQMFHSTHTLQFLHALTFIATVVHYQSNCHDHFGTNYTCTANTGITHHCQGIIRSPKHFHLFKYVWSLYKKTKKKTAQLWCEFAICRQATVLAANCVSCTLPQVTDQGAGTQHPQNGRAPLYKSGKNSHRISMNLADSLLLAEASPRDKALPYSQLHILKYEHKLKKFKPGQAWVQIMSWKNSSAMRLSTILIPLSFQIWFGKCTRPACFH